jgi:predicted permease
MFGLRDALLVPQIAFALMLVAVAGLFARSLASAGAVDPGFDARRTAFVSLNLAMSGYDDDRARQFYQSLKDRLETSGAVLKAALTDRMPLDLYGNRSATIAYGSALETRRTIQAGQAGAGYFDTMGIRIVRGRALTAADESAGARVAIVSAAAAAEFWPGADPIGQQVRIGSEAPVSTVVGVAADVKVQTLGEAPQPFVYQPLAAGRERLLRLVVRAGDPSAAVGEMRRSVHAIDPSVGVFEARSVAQYLDVMLYPYRLAAALGTVLGLLTLALAGVGLYGVLATGVSERLRDLAIRIALGAGPLAVVRSATAGALRAAAIGVVAGGALATVAGRLLAGVLFGISPADPGALVATAAVLVLVVLVSSTGPVRRALRIAPGSILRS